MACCSCCEKTGACCNDGVCSETTCADCEGLFQGVDTTCTGEDDDECPCATPADPGLCEKCVDGTPTVYCPESTPICCAGTCVVECLSSCCGWECSYVAEISWPDIEDPDDIPDISAGMIAAGWVFLDGVGYVKTITGEVDCDDPENAADKNQELEDEVDAIVAGDGGVSAVTLIPEFSGLFCADDITQEECEETYAGVFRPGVTCDEEPCEENPLP